MFFRKISTGPQPVEQTWIRGFPRGSVRHRLLLCIRAMPDNSFLPGTDIVINTIPAVRSVLSPVRPFLSMPALLQELQGSVCIFHKLQPVPVRIFYPELVSPGLAPRDPGIWNDPVCGHRIPGFMDI